MTKSIVQQAQGKEVPLVAQVFAELADGEFHSGEQLADTLGVTRSAVWKAVESLRELGATLHAVRNRGYRLRSGSDALDAERITSLLPVTVRSRARSIETAWTVDSTNSVLLARPNPPFGICEIFLAEYQTAGRGRRGRTWVAPPGGSICLSLSWTFEQVPQELGALGLAIGVCVLRTLKDFGIESALKWPNDILVDGKKLGGILIELRAESDGPACVIIGIGLNVALGASLLQTISGGNALPPIDLVTAGLTQPSRNGLVATLVSQVIPALMAFEKDGLRPFVEEWRVADALRGSQVDVHTTEGVARGLARGIDLHGALVVETPQGVKRFISGDVTVRAVE